ncbi:hypothetical protein K503DRAFT_787177 [Rhizopogon vinicolor AM-OR11-026]|uniref:Uncharacterized protein n=1 Tax=Rhizopogon vinicolor AM-OR11-026 TaxID=1314800 RepID=A0A1B7MIN3_9AGAM|nr:hypothetical protein K503DRAFT_787177 [Rhizopogon vinicolor AM-OR11-026]
MARLRRTGKHSSFVHAQRAVELEALAIAQLAAAECENDEFLGLAIAVLAVEEKKRARSKKYGRRVAYNQQKSEEFWTSWYFAEGRLNKEVQIDARMGQHLENLSWCLWHLQNLIVNTENAKSKHKFKELSKHLGDKFDKEKGHAIESLEAPDFKRNTSTNLVRQRAVERLPFWTDLPPPPLHLDKPTTSADP